MRKKKSRDHPGIVCAPGISSFKYIKKLDKRFPNFISVLREKHQRGDDDDNDDKEEEEEETLERN